MRDFTIGDKVHWKLYSDVYPGTIIDTERGGRTLVVRYDQRTKAPGSQWYDQNWIVQDGENDDHVALFTARKDGTYALKGCDFGWLRDGWRAYWDPSF